MPDHAELAREIIGHLEWLCEAISEDERKSLVAHFAAALAAVERDTAAQLRQAEHDSERFEEMLRHCVRLLVIIGAPRPEGDDTETPLERDQREAAWACLETISRSCPDIVADSRGAGHA